MSRNSQDQHVAGVRAQQQSITCCAMRSEAGLDLSTCLFETRRCCSCGGCYSTDVMADVHTLDTISSEEMGLIQLPSRPFVFSLRQMVGMTQQMISRNAVQSSLWLLLAHGQGKTCLMCLYPKFIILYVADNNCHLHPQVVVVVQGCPHFRPCCGHWQLQQPMWQTQSGIIFTF